LKKSILNIGSGKIEMSDYDSWNHIMHLDGSYPTCNYTDPIIALERYIEWLQYAGKAHVPDKLIQLVKSDIFDFMYSWPFKFQHINADRIFEHMFYDSGQIGQLLDACNQITTDDATMSIVVPNHLALANMLIDTEEGWLGDEAVSASAINSQLLQINTEFCNTRVDPHGSIWTPALAKHYIESEGNAWKIVEIVETVKLKGRDIYMCIELSKQGGENV